ncbi:MAG: NADH-quinone oxidoreductase subunit J [Anaerolineaceae bacterium]|nr:NADH-quinone oxidoreductase subunit J [Anaerolineaceae bacterium]
MEILVLSILAIVVVGSALGLIMTERPVYAALFLILNFATVAIFYMMLGAPFIAMTQVTVYAGAIMVLFLFVIMLLGTEKVDMKEPLRGQRFLAAAAGFVLLVETAVLAISVNGVFSKISQLPADYGSPRQLGILLFRDNILPLMIISVLLLTATIGAVVLSRHQLKSGGLTIEEKREKRS